MNNSTVSTKETPSSTLENPSRKNRKPILIAAAGGLAMLVGALTFIFVIDETDIYVEGETGDSAEATYLRPETLQELSMLSFDGDGPLNVDLSGLQLDLPGEQPTYPVDARFAVAEGDMRLIAPADLDASIGTEITSGTLDYAGELTEENGTRRTFGDDEADIKLDLSVADGDLYIERP